MNIENLTPQQLRKAADLQEKIASLEHELSIIFVGGKPHTPVKSAQLGKRKMSAGHKAKIRAAQKLRWSKFHAKAKPAAKPEKRAKRKMSAAGRAAIVAAQKARWAKIKAEKN